jgi:hypothetical protein
MQDPKAEADLSAWLARMARAGREGGYFHALGARHWALFRDDGPVLLVTFERLETFGDNASAGLPAGLPAGMALAQEEGWSCLSLVASGETWFRDPAIFAFVDRLVQEAFFEGFDRVLFYGAAMGAYAACAYSVAAPGAVVLAVQPVATLDPARAGWDQRHRRQRRIGFTGRYGYAPDMADAASQVWLLHDPRDPMDAMHAALFVRPHVHLLGCPHLGPGLDRSLAEMGLLAPLIHLAGEGHLSPALFHRLYRQRRHHAPYLRRLMAATDAARRPFLSAMVARHAMATVPTGPFRRRLAELEADLAALADAGPGAERPSGAGPLDGTE